MLKSFLKELKTLWEREKMARFFYFSHIVFKRLVLQTRKNKGLFGKGLKHQQQTAFENNVGKEEIARNEQFLLFPQCFLLNKKTVSPFISIYDITSLFAAESEKPKVGM